MQKLKSLLFILLTFSFVAQAGVGLSQTRIIIEEATNSASITARNEDNKAYLVASFITQQLDSKTPSEGLFVITPSIFKLAPNQRNIIKIKAISHKFPKDRESMYYFHSRNVPESDQADGMKIGLESVIKIFYRPANLSMNQDDAFKNIKIIKNTNGVRLINNSPYYINLAGLSVNNKAIKLNKQNNVIAPLAEMNYTTQFKVGAVKWAVINDLGGYNEYHGTVE
ncbi:MULTISPECIES: molecular chaperone [Providencia]|uniref:Molecular chaperone n=1 Tax=Providencia rettgeri TaxID=587 RepID=A0A427HBB3_PRORE|nr:MULTISPECIES: molecular chaperone [Providencia]ELR5075903.1 molecular chaperone [Providencia stuartii]ELR5071566.1 molecular chaperone [Providencia rettgeri]ELR5219763.1 molecular chaperone [Providencia rettgeri]ELR5223912.1 molecular chaperone [Providencia rettgeri]MBV2188799.1 molecular chaperone [Providencia rettgeri]